MINWNAYATPCYVIDTDRFEQNCKEMIEAFEKEWGKRVQFGYSVKTNNQKGLIQYAMEKLGWKAEVVSMKEYKQIEAWGYTGEDLILNGPYKGSVLSEAYKKGSIINIDNLQEIQELIAMIKEGSVKNCRGIGIRVNIDLEKMCPGETTAGDEGSRFGICYENGDFGRAVLELKNAEIPIDGLHMHTSTKTRSSKVFQELANAVNILAEQYEMDLKYVDIGGGFFGGQKIEGKPTMEEYARCICETLRKKINPQKTTLILEPGAAVIATSAYYVTRVVNLRSVREDKVITLDGSVLHINPFLQKRTPIYRVYRYQDGRLEQKTHTKEQIQEDFEKQIVCGCTCMEADRFFNCKDIKLEREDILVFPYTGAYTMAFNSEFILEPPNIYYVTGGER